MTGVTESAVKLRRRFLIHLCVYLAVFLAPVIVTVALGATTPDIDFELGPAGGIAGQVLDAATGGPVPEARVSVFDIIKRRYWYFLFSALIMVPGLISLALYGLPRSIDFVGGSVFVMPAIFVNRRK